MKRPQWFKAHYLAFVLPAAMFTGSWLVCAVPIQQAYIKASNTGAADNFGSKVSMSGDTLIVAAPGESSNAVGVNGNQTNNLARGSGAAYVFVRTGTNWIQQAYLKASNTERLDEFGRSVSISGETLVVGASFEDSSATGVNGDQTNNSDPDSGAAYVFVRDGTNWSQQAYLKPFVATQGNCCFGQAVAISGDTIIVGSRFGVAHIFVRNGTNWFPQTHLDGAVTGVEHGFGHAVAISRDTTVVGASLDSSDATGVNGTPNNMNSLHSGAAYIFVRTGTNWSQQAYLKASNNNPHDRFGIAVATSGDTVIVGAFAEDSNATGVNGNQNDDSVMDAGAAYVFVRTDTNWSQQAYLKAFPTSNSAWFGISVALLGDLATVGARESDTAYTFRRWGTNWEEQFYIKGSITEDSDAFGSAVAVSEDTVVVAAEREASNATGVNGDQSNNGMGWSGAVYVFTGVVTGPRLAIAPDGNGGYFIRCHAATGVNYQLLRATNVTGLWTTNIATITLSPGLLEFHDTNAPHGQAFYRVVHE